MNWSTIIASVVGLLSGLLSGGLTAYTQLNEAQEKYLIAKVDKFEKLFKSLGKPEEARFALLNLWQLYPDKEDEKIIVTVAIETDQSDLIEMIVESDQDLAQYKDILKAKVNKDTKENISELTANPAMQVLVRVAPDSAAKLMFETLDKIDSNVWNGFADNENVDVMTDLIRNSDAAAETIRKEFILRDEIPLLIDYMFYRAGKSSNFIERIAKAYEANKEITSAKPFLTLGRFHEEDTEGIVRQVQNFITVGLTGRTVDMYDIADAFSALRNGAFSGAIQRISDDKFEQALKAAILDSSQPDLIRQLSMEFSSQYFPRSALIAMAQVLQAPNGDNNANQLGKEFEEQLNNLINQAGSGSLNLPPLTHCMSISAAQCLNDRVAWKDWLIEQEAGG